MRLDTHNEQNEHEVFVCVSLRCFDLLPLIKWRQIHIKIQLSFTPILLMLTAPSLLIIIAYYERANEHIACVYY